MTRKDYTNVAKAIVQIWFEMRLPRIEMEKIINSMSMVLQNEYINFNSVKFSKYINEHIDELIKSEEPF